jgi:hypothetical protein
LKHTRLALLALLSALALGPPALARARKDCPVGHLLPEADLYFGLSVKNAPDVTDTQFSDFLDREVSTRFPQGLTVIDAQGRWRGEDGKTVREPSKIVQIVLPGARDDLAKLDAVRNVYKRQFHQEAVLEVLSKTCAAF